MGTALGPSRGCRASRRCQRPSSFNRGMVAPQACAHLALAKTRSRWPRTSTARLISCASSRTRAVRSRRIRRSSSFSSWRSMLSSLFSSRVDRGSMKNVARDWEWSWMIPGRVFLNSALTATTYRSLRRVMICSWKILRSSSFSQRPSRAWRIRARTREISRRRRRSSGLAESRISPRGPMAE